MLYNLYQNKLFDFNFNFNLLTLLYNIHYILSIATIVYQGRSLLYSAVTAEYVLEHEIFQIFLQYKYDKKINTQTFANS